MTTTAPTASPLGQAMIDWADAVGDLVHARLEAALSDSPEDLAQVVGYYEGREARTRRALEALAPGATSFTVTR